MPALTNVGKDKQGNIIYRATFVPPHKDNYGSPTIKFLSGSGKIGYMIDGEVFELAVTAGSVVTPDVIDFENVSHWFTADDQEKGATFIRRFRDGVEPEVLFKEPI